MDKITNFLLVPQFPFFSANQNVEEKGRVRKETIICIRKYCLCIRTGVSPISTHYKFPRWIFFKENHPSNLWTHAYWTYFLSYVFTNVGKKDICSSTTSMISNTWKFHVFYRDMQSRLYFLLCMVEGIEYEWLIEAGNMFPGCWRKAIFFILVSIIIVSVASFWATLISK